MFRFFLASRASFGFIISRHNKMIDARKRGEKERDSTQPFRVLALTGCGASGAITKPDSAYVRNMRYPGVGGNDETNAWWFLTQCWNSAGLLITKCKIRHKGHLPANSWTKSTWF